MKEKIERSELQRKFILSHRNELIKLCTEVLNKFIKRVTNHRTCTRTCISLVKNLKISKYLLSLYYVRYFIIYRKPKKIIWN